MSGGKDLVSFSLENDQPRLQFERNPLDSVVWQMRFPPLPAVGDSAAVARFQSAIRDEYPLTASSDRGRGEGGSSAGHVATAHWRFSDEEESWTVALEPEFLALKARDYLNFEDFRARLERVLEAAEEVLDITHTERIGLRYVDHVRLPGAASPADFADYLNADLIGVVAGRELSECVIEAMQLIRLEVADHEMTMRHGFVPPDEDSGAAPFYLLDTDAYREARVPYERSSCLALVDAFKRRIWNFFRQSINDNLVEYLKPRDIDA